MKISKFAQVIVSNASISLEELEAFLRMIHNALLSLLPQDEKGKIKWDLSFHSAQGEVLPLSSAVLGEEVARWIQERVILKIKGKVSSAVGGFHRNVEFEFRVGHIVEIDIKGGSDFVDLISLRLTEWKNKLPRARIPFFRLAVFVCSLCVGVCVFFALFFTILHVSRQYGYDGLNDIDDWGLFGDIIRLSILGGAIGSGIRTGEFLVEIFPPIDLNFGSPAKWKKRRNNIIKGLKWLAGAATFLGGVLALHNFFAN